MLASISPVGEAARRQRWGVTTAAYLLGSAVGGGAVGGALGAVGAVMPAVGGDPTAALPVLAAVAGLGIVADRRIAGLRVPSWHRQVDERWLVTYRGWVYGLGYGVQLGAGVVTRVPASVTWVMLAAALLTASPAEGAVIGIVFGLSRALPLLATGGLRTPGRLQSFHRRLAGLAVPVEQATTAVQLTVAASALTLVLWRWS